MDRVKLDKAAGILMKALASSSLLILFLIVIGLLSKSEMILSAESLPQLILSSDWKPSRGLFGFYPFITGTILVTFSTMVFSVPLCLLAAIYLAEYASKGFRSTVKGGIDTLAGIPSVIFGLWGVLFIVPFIRDFVAPAFGYETSGYCILSGSLVLTLMVVPIMLSIMQEIIMSVPQDLKESSYAVGATRWETIKKIILPKTSAGLFSAVILGFSRAFGETMAVLMVVGNVASNAQSPFDPVYPLTALIANNYGEMMSVPLYESALLFGALLLLMLVVAFDLFARYVIRRLHAEGC
ncbi:MAG: phosphate ABC transporter permease subunit PstC [Candidatus Altiarchaeota archaeon]